MIWYKGEESGHIQEIKEVLLDCDEDAIIFKVKQVGGACHTGHYSCFYKKLSDDNKSRLDEVLKRNENLEEEVKELRQQVMVLMTSICTDLSCQIRKGNYEDVIKLKGN